MKRESANRGQIIFISNCNWIHLDGTPLLAFIQRQLSIEWVSECCLRFSTLVFRCFQLLLCALRFSRCRCFCCCCSIYKRISELYQSKVALVSIETDAALLHCLCSQLSSKRFARLSSYKWNIKLCKGYQSIGSCQPFNEFRNILAKEPFSLLLSIDRHRYIYV